MAETITCRFCGTKGERNFCSECGSRLDGEPLATLDKMSISVEWMERLADKLDNMAYDDPSRGRLERDSNAVSDYVNHVQQLASALIDGEPFMIEHAANRMDMERVLKGLPSDVPDRDRLMKAAWTVVTDAEQLARATKLIASQRDHFNQLERAVEAGSLARATTAFIKLRTEVATHGNLAELPPITDLEDRLEVLKRAEAEDGYAKLWEKAEKLAFVEDWKKAKKAVQECLFWLSKNAHSQAEKQKQLAEQLLARCLQLG